MTSLDKLRVTAQIWDSDKDAAGFSRWMRNFSSMVRILKDGAPIEDFIDAKLERHRSQEMTTPSYILSDRDFDKEPPPGYSPPAKPKKKKNAAASDAESSDEEIEADEAEAQTGAVGKDDSTSLASGGSGNKTFVMPTVDSPYWMLPLKSRELDQLLFSTLKHCVRGSKSLLLDSVAFASYAQGVIILTKHMEISRLNRKASAFSKLRKLEFRGDVHSYQVECMSRVQELLDSKANIADYILWCIVAYTAMM